MVGLLAGFEGAHRQQEVSVSVATLSGVSDQPSRPRLRSVGRSLLLDRRARAAVEHLREAGIPSILLKGAAIATWLYDDGTPRPYIDIDLFVSPADFPRAIEVLAEIGYRVRLPGAHPAELGPKELDLLGPDEVAIDLHHGLLGVTIDSQQCFEVLAGRRISLSLAGGHVDVLDIPARALHLALHAAQNGPIDVKAVTDLRRGIAKVAPEDWREAALVAQEIGATEALAAGLRLVPEGQVLADDLNLTRRMSVELALRTLSVTQDALFFERFSETRGTKAKLGLLARKFFPTATTLRANSPLANRSRLGLMWVRVTHPVELAVRFVPAFRAWRFARRKANPGA